MDGFTARLERCAASKAGAALAAIVPAGAVCGVTDQAGAAFGSP
jgi:hypothetical protein